MIILLQSVITQFRKFFLHIFYFKMQKSNFITKCYRLLLQSVSGITNCDSYYKVRCNTSGVQFHLLQVSFVLNNSVL